MYVHPPAPSAVRPWFFRFYAAVVVVQGVHVIEHVIQLVQVYVFGVPDDDALGLLGYVFAFQGTEEWLHLVFNAAYRRSPSVLLLLPLRGLVPRAGAGLGVLGLRGLAASASRAGTSSSTG